MKAIQQIIAKYNVVAAAGLLLVMFFLQVGSSRSESQTIDEAVHLVAGYSYLVTGDYRLNPEHPPLVKMLSALPLLALQLKFSTDSADWHTANQWGLGRSFLYENTVPGEVLLQLARIPNMLLGLLLGWVIFWLSRALFGYRVGLLALLFYVFDPLFLAHSHYLTTDTGAALFFLLTVFAWYRYLGTHQRSDLLLSAVFFALAQMTKFSAVILLPILIILFFIARWQARGTVPLSSKKEVSAPHTFPRFSLWSLAWAVAVLAVSSFAAALVFYQGNISSYLAGLQYVRWHNATGHFSFLFGHYSTAGWWYYFPLAWLVKTPFTTVILLFLALISWFKRSLHLFLAQQIPASAKKNFFRKILAYFRTQPLLFYAFSVPPLVYMLWSMTSHINLGVRHLSVIYPFVFMTIGTLALVRLERWQRCWRVLLGLFVAIYFFMNFLTYPRYISYFSELVGGSRQGYTYLLDSNTDWGQGLNYLQEFLEQRDWQDETVFLATLTTVDPEVHGIAWQPFPDAARTATDLSQLPAGIYVLAASYPITGDVSFQWLLDQYPREQVADIYFVYDLRR